MLINMKPVITEDAHRKTHSPKRVLMCVGSSFGWNTRNIKSLEELDTRLDSCAKETQEFLRKEYGLPYTIEIERGTDITIVVDIEPHTIH